ncbi:MAG: DUF5057 domain-containing protein [Lachnospiraceae bacterium]|nr:DUF5057 domain-containing protein [Lachnospiraceae bacterium]
MSKKKVILSTIAILIVMFAAVSMVSYSIANLGHGDNNETIEQTELTNLGAGESDYITNIDLILENAVKGEKFNIVEITPAGVTASDLSKYSTDGFEKYVLYDNRSSFNGDMPTGYVNYYHLEVSSNTELTKVLKEAVTDADGKEVTPAVTVQSLLNSADLIYLSSPTYTSYNGAANMSEDVYNQLHLYISNNKPIIVDYVTSTSVSAGATKTYSTLVNIIAKNYYKFRTYPWKTGLTAEKFFKAQGSYYLKNNVNNRTTKASGKVLVLTASSSTTPVAGSMHARMEEYGSDNIKASAYYGKSANKPDKITYTVRTVSNDNPLTVDELKEEYDFILIEKDVKDVTLSDDVYTKLRALSEASNYIFYDASIVDSTEEGIIDSSANNYLKLMNLVVSEKGIEKTKNALAVSYGYFTSLYSQKETNVEGAKAIADILDGSVYRDSDKTGAGSRKYRVLEIQPCYPIDLYLAQNNSVNTTKYSSGNFGAKGGYYTIPDQVLYGVTKDEVEEGQEYYAFEISKAKIAHATGLPYDQIEVVQMSTNELSSSKEVLAESYDMVYIGGDSSAYVPYESLNWGGGGTGEYNGKDNRDKWEDNLTAFTMFTHTGLLVNYHYTYNTVSATNNSVEFSGNDITTIKRDELKAYVDSGLPIIIDEVVTDAFEASYKFDKNNKKSDVEPSRLEQLALTEIDPDCNMYQFLAYTYEKFRANTASNVGWATIDSALDDDKDLDVSFENGIHNSEQQIENADVETGEKIYGNTLGSMVTVYEDDCAKAIKALYTNSAKRPQFTLSKYPEEYHEGDKHPANYNPKYEADPANEVKYFPTVDFTVGVKASDNVTTSSNYTVSLYIDANGDGYYSKGENDDIANEEIMSETCAAGGSVDLSYELTDDFSGLVNWKILVTDESGLVCDMKMGSSWCKAVDGQKEINILQIMPVDNEAADHLTANKYMDDHSLYFCTECQLAGKIVEYNVNLGHPDFGQVEKESNKNNETIFGGAIKMGKHEHDFGIVKYDSIVNRDDLDSNFADELTHDEEGYMSEDAEYAFNLEIVTAKEFDALCDAARNRTTEQMTNAKAQEKALKSQMDGALATAQGYEEALENELFIAANDIRTANSEKYANVISTGIGYAGDDPKTTEIVEEPGQWIKDKQYHKIWVFYNDSIGSTTGSITNFDKLATAYNNYSDAYTKYLELKEQYNLVLKQKYNANNWLKESYNVIVLGFADRFANKDLETYSCEQIKKYVEADGAVFNTHDTLVAKKDSGSKNISKILRATFGMDRFHVVDYSEMNTVEVSSIIPTVMEQRVDIGNVSWGSFTDIKVKNKDIELTVKDSYGTFTILDWKEVGDEKPSTEDIMISVVLDPSSNPSGTLEYRTENGDTLHFEKDANGSYVPLKIKQKIENVVVYADKTITIGNQNITGTYDIGTKKLDFKADGDAVEGNITVTLSVTNNGNALNDGHKVSVNFRGTVYEEEVSGGVVVFSVDPAQAATKSIFDTPADTESIYQRFPTKDPAKFFWTERLQTEKESEYYSTISTNGLQNMGYNAPVGITDLYASYDSSSDPVSPYLYVMSSYEAFEQSGNADGGYSFEAKHGTRTAQKVNEGGVTMFPFSISDQLRIAPAHAQAFTLDLEDPSVAVWYTLGANYRQLNVEAYQSRYASGFYTASPRDGLNNYFLYSKDTVFYSGAGHQLITGRNKDNNDERKLFINVLVNCVSKAKMGPSLKLYNKCTTAGCDHKGECEYVNPKDDKTNKELAKNLNKLFYNKSEKMYQYNIDDSQTNIYPEFDFKAIAGTAELDRIEVFYDLDYDEDAPNDDFTPKSDGVTGDEMITYNPSVLTNNDPKNTTIASQMDGKRVFLRESSHSKLLLKKEYFTPYNNYTYIVIKVTDTAGKEKTARIKINIIPYLFDLTDAGSEAVNSSFDSLLLDMSDRKFNI